MDFARKQMEKYGWTDGKGLGKHENGMAEALKPKLKRSLAGVGHDPAAEFNEHWWTTLYDKAAGNVEVLEKNGKTKKIKRKDDNEFEITNSTWKLNRKQKDSDKKEQYADHFVRTAVLDNGENRMDTVREPSDGEEEKRDVIKMTDEEIFAVCEGRTAHKGARHGLRATGKLARIAQQEALLLSQSKYSGYSHAKKLKDNVVEEMNLNSDPETVEHKRKKKKKRCNSTETPQENIDCEMAESTIPLPTENDVTGNDDVASVIKEKKSSKKSKKSKKKDFRDIEVIPEEIEENQEPKKKKKRRDDSPEHMETSNDGETLEVEDVKSKKSKKKTNNLYNDSK